MPSAVPNPVLKPVYRGLSRDQSYRLPYLFWKNWFSRFKSEITSFWIWAQYIYQRPWELPPFPKCWTNSGGPWLWALYINHYSEADLYRQTCRLCTRSILNRHPQLLQWIHLLTHPPVSSFILQFHQSDMHTGPANDNWVSFSNC